MNPSKICPKPMHWWCWATSRETGSHLYTRQPAAARNGEEEKPTSNAPAVRLCLLASDSCARLPRPGGGGGIVPGKLRHLLGSSDAPRRPREQAQGIRCTEYFSDGALVLLWCRCRPSEHVRACAYCTLEVSFGGKFYDRLV